MGSLAPLLPFRPPRRTVAPARAPIQRPSGRADPWPVTAERRGGLPTYTYAVQRYARRAATPLAWALALLLVPGCGDEEPEDAPIPPSGAVATATPEATAAGIRVLALGGNAVDAAVAVSLALGVTEPSESGLGGSVVMLIAPVGTPPVVVHAAPETITTPTGSVLRPTALPVLVEAWKRYGSGNVSWEELVEPARRLAERGYMLGRFRHRMLVSEYRRLMEDSLATTLVLNADRSIPGEGTTVALPALAATLEQIAGTSRDDLPGGPFLTALAADGAALLGPTAGSALAATVPVRSEPAVTGSYRGWTVVTTPAPYAGRSVLRALELLAGAPVDALRKHDEVRGLWLAEAFAYASEPSGAPLGAYLATLPPLPLVVDAASRPAPARRAAPAPADGAVPAPAPATTDTTASGQETSHFSIVDGSGMAVSVTQSLGGPFGQRATRLGFFLGRPPNEEVAAPTTDSAGRPTDITRIASPLDYWTEPVQWAVPTILVRDGVPGLVLGSAGGPRAISAVVQVIADWVDGGQPIERAVADPRLHVDRDSLPRPRLSLEGVAWIDPVAGSPEALAPWGPSMRQLAVARGLRLGERMTGLEYLGTSPFFGGVQAVAREDEAWVGAADPRRDGDGRTLTEEDVIQARQDQDDGPDEQPTGVLPHSGGEQ